MRELNEAEQKIVEKGWLYHLGNRRPSAVDYDFYEAGFIAALDHSATQIAALQAENTRLQVLTQRQSEALKILTAISERREVMIRDLFTLNGELEAERDRLRAALQQIAAGNPAPPGKWLTDIQMADIARKALGEASNG